MFAQRDQQRSATASQVYNELANALRSGGTVEQVAITKIHTGNTGGGLLRRMAEYNTTGFVAGPPWQWPPEPVSDQVIAILATIGVPAEESSEGRIGTVGGLLVNFGEGDPARGAQRAADLLRNFVGIAEDFADRLEQAEQSTPFAIVDQGRVAGIGQVGVRTVLPFSRSGEAAGRNVEFNRDFFRNMDPAIVLAMWARFREVNIDVDITEFVDRRRFSGEI